MEEILKRKLGTTRFEITGYEADGCISKGRAYQTDNGIVFVKTNNNKEADLMFQGEYASLQAIEATKAVRVPHPIGNFSVGPYGEALVTEFLDFGNSSREFSSMLGTNLARMHLHNAKLLENETRASGYVGKTQENTGPMRKFGFHTTTCCGFIPHPNNWNDDWATFFIRNRLKVQVDRIIEEKGDREIVELWPRLERAAEKLLNDENELPALVHGDLWSGNWASTEDEPVIFDPASFYGTSEFEFGMINMSTAFKTDKEFHEAYHKLIPKRDGFGARTMLYELFHHLNHWNHFDGTYRASSLSLAHSLLC
ncbi:fructosamine kinase domain-containing protein [Ditylenchus destructor]|uniref:protein-ribulosamine 3-kinase n=1 Tax=Ditylenchus destructor TaxID=166010 RepID=A0AAD4MU34_9BILA|nr:fructosamine kinase domain-containing protein [Ditylenchus destructor]